MNVNPAKYVVLDVETNGRSSINHDLLSISIYQPDTQKMYNRFLPLELNGAVFTTHINGITKNDLKKATPLTQEEVDELFEEYDLDSRTILTYGSLDEKFIRNYFRRKKLSGFEKMHFFNFKRNIISSSFSEGNITKDNLCGLFGIDNIQEVHTGENDCLLEWELFKKLDGNKLFITNNKVFEFNNEYIVPAGYLTHFPNFKYHTQNLPRFKCSSRIVKKFEVSSDKIKKFPTNFNGITIEHLINTMLEAEVVDSTNFLIQNKSKLKYIGKLPTIWDEICMSLNSDGTVAAIEKKDESLADELNKFLLVLKDEIKPLVSYIKKNIFQNKHILSQELVIHKDKNVLALCDWSSNDAVLELKTYGTIDLDKIGNQLFYESNGRDCYIMNVEWFIKKCKMKFVISKVDFQIDDSIPLNSLENRILNFRNRISNKQVDVIEYVDSNSRVTLRCQVCGNTYSKSYNAMLKRSECPYCNPHSFPKTINKTNGESKPKIAKLTKEEKRLNRSQKYFDKVKENSKGLVSVLQYNGAKEKLTAHCNECGNEWEIRADHLLVRTYCPLCRKRNSN